MTGSIGDFDLQGILGRGASATVWRAVHRPSQQPVALKLLEARAPGPGGLNHFFREVRAVAALDHPSIVQVYDQGLTTPQDAPGAGHPYLVMELATEGTLRELRGRLEWTQLQSALVAILDALAHAHARGVIHRDLKPSNVLKGTRRAPWVLTDFGVARLGQASHNTNEDTSAGTPGTMAPEQLLPQHGEIGPWTDLYALGCTAWALATGELPFQRPTLLDTIQAQISDQPPAFMAAHELPPSFEAWVRRLLEKRPQDRYMRASHARRALVAIDDDSDEDAPTVHARMGRLVGPRGLGLGLWGLRPTPLVGRESALRQLRDAVRSVARDGRARAVIVRGPAGVGKSRLCETLLREMHAAGAASTWTAFHGESGGPDDGLRGLIARSVGDATGLRAGRFPDIRPPVDAADDDLLQSWLSGRATLLSLERWNLAKRLIERSTVGPPHIVWLDDVQWGVDALGWIHWLLEAPQGSPVLVVATVRDEALNALPEATSLLARLEGSAEVIHLGPLSAADSATLTRDWLGLDREASAEVDQRAGGNPLYAIQLVDHWVREGALRATDDGFRATIELRAPTDLMAVWSERIQSILEGRSDDEVLSIELTAVLSQVVDEAEWQRACAELHIEPAHALVMQLFDLRLLRTVEDGRSWSFVHPMLRESLIRRCGERGELPRVRQAAIATLLQRRDLEGMLRRAEQRVALGTWDSALDDLVPVAEAAANQIDDPRMALAMRLADRAYEVLGPSCLDRWMQIATEQTSRYGILGRRADIDALAARMHRHVDDPEAKPSPSSRVLMASIDARIQLIEGHADRGIAIMQACQEAIAPSADDDALGLCDYNLARLFQIWDGRPEAEALIQRSLRSSLVDRTSVLLQLAAGMIERPADRPRVRDLLTAALATTNASGSRAHAAFLWGALGELEWKEHHPEQADDAWLEAIRIAGLQGHTAYQAIVAIRLGSARLQQGRPRDAIAHYDMAVQVGTPGSAATATVLRWVALALTGDWQAFQDEAPRAKEAGLENKLLVDLFIAEWVEEAAHLAKAAGHTETASIATAMGAKIRERMANRDQVATPP